MLSKTARKFAMLLAAATFIVEPCLIQPCASVEWNPLNWQLPSSTAGDPQEVGTKAWWKKHKKKAEFVPGEGFRVEGFAGYFDQEGRPIQAKVAKVVKPKEGGGLLQDANLIETVDEVKTQLGMGPDAAAAREAYARGEDLFRRGEYAAAADAFDEAVDRDPNAEIEQDALFYLAESYFFANEYSKAVSMYGDLLDKYPNSQHLDKVVRRQFDIARYWEKYHEYDPNWVTTPNFIDDTRPWFDTLGNAIKTYENIRLKDPTGPLADDAIMTTANSYFLRGRYSDADYHYQILRQEYPQSEHQFEAHLLGLQSKIRKYQGPNYDGTPLEEAKKLVKQIKQQFGSELSVDERERLNTQLAQLNEALAERDFSIAKYYDDTKHYVSAKFYYAKIAQEYPTSELGTQARARYDQIVGLPDHPETKVGWFLNMFPENAERKTLQQVPLLAPESEIGLASRPQTEGGQSDGSTIYR
ncbi:MAG: outer membrane protein assembly factor BamD [Bythopirellula sp.]|nr:outer membrane protein assembly factor BamD [Bythopirellula sp.]